MSRRNAPSENPLLEAVHEGSSKQGFDAVRLETKRGPIECRLYPVPSPRAAVFVGGIGGNWDTPASGLYPRLCADLPPEGTCCLRVRYRDPSDLNEAEFDLIAAVEYLQRRHVTAVALVGHSLGGAAAIRAAACCSAVRTVVTLSTQSYGAEPIETLGPDCSVLLIHGLEDRTLSPTCSSQLHAKAKEPKRLLLLPKTGHTLDEAAQTVLREVRTWIAAELRKAAPELLRPEHTTGPRR